MAAWGVEARVPFLDHQLVELAASMPPELKLASEGKHVLKQIARGRVGELRFPTINAENIRVPARLGKPPALARPPIPD